MLKRYDGQEGRTKTLQCNPGEEVDGGSIARDDRRIVMIHNNGPQWAVLAQVLRDAGYRTIEAREEGEALRLIGMEPPDLVMLDSSPPDADRLEICRGIKSSPRTSGLPVILISTGVASVKDRVRALDSGADALLGTPVESAELLAQIRALLRLRAAENARTKSEEKYRALFGSIDEGFAVVEMLFDQNNKPVDYRFLEINATWERQTGLKAPLGKSARELVPDLDEFWFEIYGKVALTGEPIRFEHHAPAMHRWFDVYAFPFDPGTRKVGIHFKDISERKRAEEALRESEERFRTMADGLPLIVWVHDAQGAQQFVNRTFCEFFGVEIEQMRGGKWQALMHPDDAEAYAGQFFASVRERRLFHAEVRVRNAAGQWRWIESWGRPRFSATGQFLGYVGASADITERKKAEQAVHEAQDELLRLNAELEQRVQERTAKLRETIGDLEHFSYTITHDMRAPLRAMRAFGDILREEYADNLDEIGRDFLRRIVESAQRMDHLITDALNYSKIVQEEMTLEPVDGGVLLRGMVETYPEFQPPRAEVEIAGPFPPVMGNRAGLTQCFSNLLGNAVKFVHPGQKPRVRVWAEERDSYVRFWIEDAGIGIEPEQQQRIFEMFQRLSRGYEGTGIGLALVRKVVERMKGRVGVESQPGAGSRFWVELARAEGMK